MKKIGLLSLFSLLTIFAFASFPVETQAVLTDPESDKFKLDTLGFIVGILTCLLLPYSLLLLLIKKKNFRGSLAFGWLAGFILLILVVIAILADFDISSGLY
jgi:hypothetical protein